ncbi:MAG TPA: hypothetical protein VEH57_07915 [Thermoplasmata archaeon]|nr:hypothetical protein [Thermoplasmata archaeon]
MPDEAPLPDYQAAVPVKEATLPPPPPDPGRCPYCGMKVNEGSTHCQACGRRIREDPPPDVPIPDEPWVPTNCPRCGRPMERGVLQVEDVLGRPINAEANFQPIPATNPETRKYLPAPERVLEPTTFRLWRHPELRPVWHWCRFCRLLHYPLPTTEE